ncbi:2-oxo-4-hydroxy-4-carboxy-5-ureidoimidazoline decarboxylase [Azospirillum sp. ST 5-10]|uniref:2-oxo-4-hydroxy-4-carboxy-5-ureidoimidazoline decarboxylase n=1 Tax=unclassified Azospirillum TaxID=2630922 RepID=UPI003F4A23C7
MKPSSMDRERFLAAFGGVFEHSPWIAQAVWDGGLGPQHDRADGLHAAMCTVFRAAGRDRQLAVLRAHPDLAGRLAVAGALTAESTAEQASAGLDRCSPEEFARFTALNAAYTARFGFPFIMAVRGRRRDEILAAFARRVDDTPDAEFATALAEVERIALLRLKELLP